MLNSTNLMYNQFETGSRMNSRIQYRLCTLFAILLFLLVGIVIFVLVYSLQDPPKQEQVQPQIVKETISIDTHVEDPPVSTQDTEFVKPMKISPLPLHHHDMLYDQMRNNQGQAPIRHHSGHFRPKNAEVWDPHPQYEIDAFGKKLVLELAHNDRFLSPNVNVIHVWENYTQRIKHRPKTSGCFYSGNIKGDFHSMVVVSLCHGMTGYIKTSDGGDYYIEPAETFEDDSTSSILHLIRKVASSAEESGFGDLDSDQCETKGQMFEKTEVFDDEDVVEDHRHIINRRSLPDHSSVNHYPTEDRRRPQVHSSNQYYIEAMVVADKKMAQYHKSDEALLHYILTLMSHVALLYKDVTIGNPITLAVVEIVILKDRHFESSSSHVMLSEFCEYQHRNSRNFHDVAILLTREMICKNTTSEICKTLGVAEVGSMCSSKSSCAIVRDRGLSTSYTIAHELGHVLSMPHDDDKKCIKYNGPVKARDIMSRMLHNGTKPWHWSSCSKHYLTEFLDSPRSHCLNNVPRKDYITSEFLTFPPSLPGESFKVDKQCELEFGSGSRMCSFMPPCGSLWCTGRFGEREGGCRTQYMPWADGTSCGKNRWCHHGECVTLDRQILSPISGAWGNWQEWGECTRTCGGGIKAAKRECNNPPPANGGPYCTGRNTKYVSCNTAPCQSNVPDFREVQCAKFNGDTKGIPGLTSSVKWIPKYGANNPEDYCKLYCRVEHSSDYYLLQQKVIDGTKCGLNSFNICVNGICREAGCDNELGSTVTQDDCGVCGGDNSKCEIVTGFHNMSNYGYHKVTKIPKGSSNIYITQTGHHDSQDDNYLALKDIESEKYILNGNFVVSTYPKELFYGGLAINYSGSNNTVEYISTPRHGKLTKDIILEVLSVGKVPPDINYTYTISKDDAPRFGWSLYGDKWSDCSSICGGIQFKIPVCKDLATNEVVDGEFCEESKRITRECNRHCKLAWRVASKGHCSVHCGLGKRTLSYSCMQFDSDGYDFKVVDDSHCSTLATPSRFEPCSGSCESRRWLYGDWSQCTQTCGGGYQTRTAKCVDDNERQIDESHCSSQNKFDRQLCNTQKCPFWLFGEWSQCSVTCGTGYRKREFYCQLDNQIYNASACNASHLAGAEEECEMAPCPMFKVRWSRGDWGRCSVTCGAGAQTRDVFCEADGYGRTEDAHCDNLLRPSATKKCSLKSCPSLTQYSSYIEKNEHRHDWNRNYEENSIIPLENFQWATGPWGQCSRDCGGGYKSRAVACRNDRTGHTMESYCTNVEKPANRMECNTHECARWKYGEWTGCDSKCQKRRYPKCVDSHGKPVDSHQCDARAKPKEDHAACLKGHCRNANKNYFKNARNRQKSLNHNVKWVHGNWSKCSNTCGRGKLERSISCVNVNSNIKVVDVFCSNLTKKPKAVKACERYKCKYTWVEGVWSQCSASCGHGQMTREVTCHKVLHGKFIDAKRHEFGSARTRDEYCNVYYKPPTTMECIRAHCTDKNMWKADPWGPCSPGKPSKQTRKLRCVNKFGEKVKRTWCPPELKPSKTRICAENRFVYNSCKEIKLLTKQSANGDYMIMVGGKPAEVYCFKMDTPDPEEYISFMSGRENYAEFYNYRLMESSTCPDGGQRNEFCDCTTLPEFAGRTSFWKVRLNITSQQIILDDYTFSKQAGNKKIPFATAGDCYSTVPDCVQGTFSVDLTGTSFRISRYVRWTASGHMASQQITASDYRVNGKCGGFCGNCMPDADVGFKVDVT